MAQSIAAGGGAEADEAPVDAEGDCGGVSGDVQGDDGVERGLSAAIRCGDSSVVHV